ncbi:hypothetical protein LCI18_008044 [Fusarium solani-melongenae]|uniref:Uncharacterized protein n=1 Tax=Fusarium solani subsp. cucurbitae TaxID=2747967 RepID=A0ACD3Z778_FUSSC|nr:hypothetical protein LCI18_008044 [Fusarium solani-melongenae]
MLFWYADEARFMERCLKENSRTLTEQEKLGRLEDMRRRLRSRCRGLIEVHDKAHASGDSKREGPDLGGTLRYLHKTVSEFLLGPTGQKMLNHNLEAYDANLRLAAASVAVANMVTGWRAINRLKSCSVFEPHISSCMHYASHAFPESTKEVLQLIDSLGDQLDQDDTFIGWDSSRAIWRRRIVDSRSHGGWYKEYTSFTDLTKKEHVLCMATKGLVLQYTIARAEYGCLLEGEREYTSGISSGIWTRRDMVNSTIRRWGRHSDDRSLSLLALPPLTDSRSPRMFEYLLRNGAKLNIDFPRILALKVRRATPWEEVLAKAITAFADGVDDEKKANVSECLRLMIDQGAKVNDETVHRAFRLAHEARICATLTGPELLHSLGDYGANNKVYEGISQDEVYKALKAMRKNKGVEFRL